MSGWNGGMSCFKGVQSFLANAKRTLCKQSFVGYVVKCIIM